MKFELLSINEDDGASDRVTAKQVGEGSIKISITDRKRARIEHIDGRTYHKSIIEFKDLDIDGLIDFLQEAKVFISEEEMVRTLMGSKR